MGAFGALTDSMKFAIEINCNEMQGNKKFKLKA